MTAPRRRRDPLQAMRVARAILRGAWLRLLIRVFSPGSRVGGGLRCYGSVTLTHASYGRITLGKHVSFGQGNLSVLPDAEFEMGDYSGINQGFTLICSARLTIGANTRIGEYVSIHDQDHRFGIPDKPIWLQGYSSAPITIGDNVWIGRGAAILKGVTIGDGSVIGANSVVTRDVPPGEVWGGVPARFIRAAGEP